MLALVLAAALVTGLQQRPAALTGGDAAAYAAWLHRRTLIADRAFGAPPCPAAEIRSLADRPLRPADVAAWSGTRQPWLGPVFFERVRLTGCGRSVVHNFQVVRLRRGGWDAMGTLPGEPLSSPRQQTELMQSLAAGDPERRSAPPLPQLRGPAVDGPRPSAGGAGARRRRVVDGALADHSLRRGQDGRGDVQ